MGSEKHINLAWQHHSRDLVQGEACRSQTLVNSAACIFLVGRKEGSPLRVCTLYLHRKAAMTETKYERAKAVISAVAMKGATEQCLAKEDIRDQVSNRVRS